MLPPGIRSVFPYFILVQPSEVQISAVLHEAFHVLQAQRYPDLLDKAENIHRLGEQYWLVDGKMRDGWGAEINSLAEALNAKTDSDMIEHTRLFLDQRQRRRKDANLDPSLIEYEKLLEWEEGLAKYVEMNAWKLAVENGKP